MGISTTISIHIHMYYKKILYSVNTLDSVMKVSVAHVINVWGVDSPIFLHGTLIAIGIRVVL